MTQEEKAKAYDEAVKRAKAAIDMAADKDLVGGVVRTIFPELSESEDESIRKLLVWQVYRNIEDETNDLAQSVYDGIKGHDPDIEESIEDWKRCLAWLEKQKENPKTADSIPSDCTSGAKCEDRWHKVEDSLPDNGREVLAKDKLGNTLLARYDGEGWDVSVYDDADYRCHNGISKWCEIPSEKQEEQKPVDYDHEMWKNCVANFEGGKKEVIEHPEKYGLQKPSFSCGHENDAEWSEEDEKMIKTIISVLERSSQVITYEQRGGSMSGSVGCSDKYKEEIAWLKSLRPQYHGDVTMTEAYKMGLEAGKASSWKPSEEQMNALNKARRFIPYNCDILESLYEQLKKL